MAAECAIQEVANMQAQPQTMTREELLSCSFQELVLAQSNGAAPAAEQLMGRIRKVSLP